ncbi:MAG: hypothetical protein ABI591_30235 [Kofleriaceae bacterium]
MKSEICALLALAGVASADPDPVTRIQPIAPSPVPGPQPVAPSPDAPVSDVPPAPTETVRDVQSLRRSDRDPGPYSYAWREPRLASGVGLGLTLGGGITGFTDRTMRNTVSSNVSGLWDLRASIGTHTPIGIDVSYLGTASNVNTLTGAPNGTLIGTTVEAAIRYNILPHNVLDPYIFAGMGWQRYDVQDVRVAQSDSGMKPTDNVAEFPMGAGLSWRDRSGFTGDLRGTFRATTDSTLVLNGTTGNYAALHSWEASAALGYEF